MRRYLREMHPVVIATGEGLDVAHAAGLTADVVVLDSRIEELPRRAPCARPVTSWSPSHPGRPAPAPEPSDSNG